MKLKSTEPRVIAGSPATAVGRTLELATNLHCDIAAARERCVDCFKDTHTHERFLFVFPRGASSMECGFVGTTPAIQYDATHFLLIPPHVPHSDRGLTKIYDAVALMPSDGQLRCILSEIDFKGKIEDLGTKRVRRSVWLAESIEKYYRERFLVTNPCESALVELERVILRDCLTSAYITVEQYTCNPEECTLVDEVVAYIEARLFESIELDELAKKFKMSNSTFIKFFKKSLNDTPVHYIRRRRLEEAHFLLKSSDHGVEDVALLVGYSEAAAFSHAFKQHFGQSPKTLIDTRAH